MRWRAPKARPYGSIRGLTRWAVIGLLLVLAAGACRGHTEAPSLLNVIELAPRRVDVGDRLDVIGTNFPEGKPATLTFRGDLFRPGQPPTRDVEIVAKAMSTSQNRISLQVTEELQEELCGRGERAEHTTFRGQVMAAFSPRDSAAPPVTGTLENVVLDVSPPSVTRQVLAERREESERTLEYLGIKLKGDGSRLIEVESLVAGGRAARAGLAAGDVLTELDGVELHSISDLAVVPGQRYVNFKLRRGRIAEPIERSVDVQGFKPTPPTELSTAVLLVGGAVSLLLLVLGPLPRLMTWAERSLVLRLRSSDDRAKARSRSAVLLAAVRDVLSQDLLPAGNRWLVLRLLPYLVFVFVSAAFTLMALGRQLVLRDLDVALLFLGSSTALVTTGLILGGWKERGWSFLAGVGHALAILLWQLPALAALAVVALTAGSLRAEHLVNRQGALPWEWHAFSSPAALLAAGLFLVTAMPESSRGGAELPALGDHQSASVTHPVSRCVMFLAEWGNLLLMSGLCVVLFLGGWRVPGLGVGEQGARIGYQVLGALILGLKCWCLVLAVLWIRWMSPRLSVSDLLGVWLRWLVPLSALAVFLTLVLRAGLKSPFLSGAQSTLSSLSFLACLFVVLTFLVRLFRNLRAPAGQLNVNPWL